MLQGHDHARRKGHLGAFELQGRRLRAPRPVLAAAPRVRRAAGRRDLDLRPRPRPVRAACRCSRRTSCDPAICAPTRATRRRSSGRCSTPRTSSASSTSRASSSSREGLCAHSRSRITGCTRCLDLCPTGAITPAGDHVAIDPYVCAGCGSCAAVCPTGAAAYALPPADALMRRLRTLLARLPGGGRPRRGRAVPRRARTASRSSTRWRGSGTGCRRTSMPGARQRGHAGRAGGDRGRVRLRRRGRRRFLVRAKPTHDIAGLHRTLGTAATILDALGYGAGVVAAIETDDPDALRRRPRAGRCPARRPASPAALPGRTAPSAACCELAFRELHRAAPAPVDAVPLAAGAPFGGLAFDAEACTLCLACVERLPDRRPLATIPTGRCCASPRACASSAGCAPRPARRT